MNSNLDRIRGKLSENKLSIGTAAQINSQVVLEILCHCGLDFIWIDAEHGPFDRNSLNLAIMTVRGQGVAPIVRVSGTDPITVKPILDMGPAAIIFPDVRTVEEAELAVASCRYPPKGIRGFGPIRANNYSKIDTDKYLEISREEPWVILQLEHIDAVNNLDKIIKVEGIGSLAIGANDLSASIGLLGQPKHPEVVKLLDKITNTCKEADFPLGIGVGSSEEDIKYWIKRGVNWISLGTDILFLLDGGSDAYQFANKTFKESDS